MGVLLEPREDGLIASGYLLDEPASWPEVRKDPKRLLYKLTDNLFKLIARLLPRKTSPLYLFAKLRQDALRYRDTCRVARISVCRNAIVAEQHLSYQCGVKCPPCFGKE